MRLNMDITVNSQMYVDLEDGRTLVINIGIEGIIMDVHSDDENGEEEEHTVEMMFSEWADWITDIKNDLNEIRRRDEKNGLYLEHEDIAN